LITGGPQTLRPKFCSVILTLWGGCEMHDRLYNSGVTYKDIMVASESSEVLNLSLL